MAMEPRSVKTITIQHVKGPNIPRRRKETHKFACNTLACPGKNLRQK